MPFDDGPYVQAACFCDMIIEDKTGVMSLIRVVDTLTHVEAGPDAPEEMPPVHYPLKLVLMLKSGSARGRSDLVLTPELPTGEKEKPTHLTVHFEGEERGQNLILNVSFVFNLEGLYWFHVHVDGQKLTSIPLRVKYSRIVATATSRVQ